MSSPHYAQSNGLLERAIQTVKNVMRKAHSSGCGPEMGMICARATPVDAKIGIPMELLYGRSIRTNLPIRTHQNEGIYTALKDRQDQQKWYYNRGSSDQPDLQVGQVVGLTRPTLPQVGQGKIMEKCPEPRSYVVQTPDGATYRRNHRFIKELRPGFQDVKHIIRKVAGRRLRHRKIEATA